MSAIPFDHQPRTRIVFGAGTLARVGELARGLGATRVLLVTDPGLVAAGHAEHGREAIAAAAQWPIALTVAAGNGATCDGWPCLWETVLNPLASV